MMAVKQKHRTACNSNNLRRKVEIPIEVQLNNDSAFLNDLPPNQNWVSWVQNMGLILILVLI